MRRFYVHKWEEPKEETPIKWCAYCSSYHHTDLSTCCKPKEEEKKIHRIEIFGPSVGGNVWGARVQLGKYVFEDGVTLEGENLTQVLDKLAEFVNEFEGKG